VRSGADEKDFVRPYLIDQKPIRLDVAFQDTLPFARQRMRIVLFWQPARLCQKLNGNNQFLDIFAAPALSPEIPAELRVLSDPPHAAL